MKRANFLWSCLHTSAKNKTKLDRVFNLRKHLDPIRCLVIGLYESAIFVIMNSLVSEEITFPICIFTNFSEYMYYKSICTTLPFASTEHELTILIDQRLPRYGQFRAFHCTSLQMYNIPLWYVFLLTYLHAIPCSRYSASATLSRKQIISFNDSFSINLKVLRTVLVGYVCFLTKFIVSKVNRC